MRKLAACTAGLAVLAAVVATDGRAAGDQNEVAAFLVFPAVLTETAPGSGVAAATTLTITHAGPEDLVAHVAFFDGATCSACEFDLPMRGQDTEVLVVRREFGRTVFRNLDTLGEVDCDGRNGCVRSLPMSSVC